jgi:hypothetical protein
MARLREKTVLPAIKSARHVTQARQSIIVLDLLTDLLHGGHYWVQNTYHDKQGRHCLGPDPSRRSDVGEGGG